MSPMQTETAKIFHSGLEGESFFLEKVRCSLGRFGDGRRLPRSVGQEQ